MILSYDNGFLFIAQPKAATHSIEPVLEAHGVKYPEPRGVSPEQLELWRQHDNVDRRHMGIRMVTRIYGPAVLKLYTFAVKRDPVDRLLSFFFFRKRESITEPSHRGFGNYTGEYTLDQYLERIESGAMKMPAPQLSRLRVEKDGPVALKKLCAYETLEADLATVFADLGLPFPGVGHNNPSEHRKGFKVADLTPEQRRRIVSLYAEDIRALGYAARYEADLMATAR